MVNCEFLIREESRSCAGCTGWFCTALGRKKKLSVVDNCRNSPEECPRYLEAHPELVKETKIEVHPELVKETKTAPVDEPAEPVVKAKPKTVKKKAKPKKVVVAPVAPPIIVTPPSTYCPYLGPIPPGEQGCCDVWCYAKSAPLRSSKHCKSPPSWRECRRKYDADRAGVKHASA